MTELLNKTEAVCRCGAGTFAELSRFLGKPPQRVTEWISQRKQSPSGRIALAMQVWTAGKTLAIAAGDRRTQKAYRDTFKAVVARRAQ